MIRKLWEIAWDLWDHRNKVLHNKDTNRYMQEVDEDIHEQFRLGSARVTKEARVMF